MPDLMIAVGGNRYPCKRVRMAVCAVPRSIPAFLGGSRSTCGATNALMSSLVGFLFPERLRLTVK